MYKFRYTKSFSLTFFSVVLCYNINEISIINTVRRCKMSKKVVVVSLVTGITLGVLVAVLKAQEIIGFVGKNEILTVSTVLFGFMLTALAIYASLPSDNRFIKALSKRGKIKQFYFLSIGACLLLFVTFCVALFAVALPILVFLLVFALTICAFALCDLIQIIYYYSKSQSYD